MTVTETLFDPFALGPDDNRYDVFARFRANAPFARGVEPFPGADKPIYAFSNRLIRDVLKHPDMLQAPPGDYLETRRELGKNRFWALMFRTILLADPPRHGDLRRFMSREFSPQRIAALETHFRSTARQVAERCAKAGSFDVVSDFAVPFIFAGLERILGVPLEDPVWMKRLTADLATGLDFRIEEETVAANHASDVMVDFVETLIARGSYHEGLLAVLIDCRDRKVLDHEDLLANVIFLLFAGQETIVDMIGNAVFALHRNPEQRERLRSGADPSKAADELIRYDPSVQFTGARIAARDIQFGDLFLEAGDGVIGVLGAGNRDPAVFGPSETLDIARDIGSSALGFGWGPHICLGRNIARLELQIALDSLYRVLPPWILDERASARRAAVNWRGMASAPAHLVGHE